ncbi:MAG: hypothetical protein EGR19_03630, partial [Dialister sp.]|nr:hypothetical protein [Dialister sp.]
ALIGVTEYLIPAVFHTIVTLSAPAGHLPLEGKAVKLSGRTFLAPHRGAPRWGCASELDF